MAYSDGSKGLRFQNVNFIIAFTIFLKSSLLLLINIRLILGVLRADCQFIFDFTGGKMTTFTSAESNRIYETRTRFYKLLAEKKKQKKGRNVVSLSKSEYKKIIKKLKAIMVFDRSNCQSRTDILLKYSV